MIKNIYNLLKILKEKKCQFYLISTLDEHLSEYSSKRNMRLKWLTNFSGSNGFALLSQKEKFFFTDGRYTLSSKKEIDRSFNIFDVGLVDFFSLLSKKLKNKKLLIDFKIFKIDFLIRLKKLQKKIISKLFMIRIIQ